MISKNPIPAAPAAQIHISSSSELTLSAYRAIFSPPFSGREQQQPLQIPDHPAVYQFPA
jgi:hypothetical protein